MSAVTEQDRVFGTDENYLKIFPQRRRKKPGRLKGGPAA